MSNALAVQRQLQKVTSARSETGVFVRMDGRFAVVNIGTSTVTVPCVGFYPPVAGMSVRVDWVNGSPAVTGPTQPLNPLGEITSTGTPRATVLVDGASFTLPVMADYTPTVGDLVAINWSMGVIMGKVAAVNTPEPPPVSGKNPVPFDVTVRAQNSGRYQPGSGWWGPGPWASSSNSGIWTYGNAVRDAVGNAVVGQAFIYLPLISEVGNAAIGVHDYGGIPGGAPVLNSVTGLGSRNGWVSLPPVFGQYLADAPGRGLGVLAPGGNGYTRWRGVDEDGLSGAVRIIGTR